MNFNINEETAINFLGEWNDPMSAKLQDAWFMAISMDFKIPNWIRYMDGMSGKKYRYLINNLVGLIDNPRYLEIGSWKGSTAASAIYGNDCTALCIDNWSQFLDGSSKENVRNEFENNMKRASTDSKVNFNYIDEDFRKVDYSSIGKFNVYMFDGPHLEQDQYDGINLVKDALDDQYFLIVDDYNWSSIRKGTEDALKQVGHSVVSSITITTWIGDGHPQLSHQYSDWHDGYYIAVVQK